MDTQDLDRSIQVLKDHKEDWARMPAGRRLDYLDSIIQRYPSVARLQVMACNRAKGIAEGTTQSGEEWAHPYQTMRLLRLLRNSLGQLAAEGRIDYPRMAFRTRSNGQLVVRVFPVDGYDRMLYRGFQGEVWMQPGVAKEDLSGFAATSLRRKEAAGRISLVLGAGNAASIGPGDLLQKLFVEGHVCLFKHNPVADYLGSILDEAFGALVEDGFLRFAHGGLDVGDYLCRHAGIDEIHLTGSDRTYEAIVFGPGPEGRERKQAGRPRLDKRLTCELGNVTPVIVTPGPWDDSDIQFHAENIVSQMVNNCGFNCLSARVLIVHKDWPQLRDLMSAVRKLLAALPQRKAYYPGAEGRYEEVMAANRTAQPIGRRLPGVLPYTVVPDLDPSDSDNPCFASECFMPLLAQTSLPGADAAEFLSRAVAFANDVLWGTLSASIIVHSKTQRWMGGGLEEAIAVMRYGTVSVNQWAALGYVWSSPTWGAFPGHVPADIQSGIGVVHNSFLLDRTEKSVVSGPFRVWPKPAWFVTNRAAQDTFPRLFEMEAAPSLPKALRIAFSALRA